jgi:hypothetical protein
MILRHPPAVFPRRLDRTAAESAEVLTERSSLALDDLLHVPFEVPGAQTFRGHGKQVSTRGRTRTPYSSPVIGSHIGGQFLSAKTNLVQAGWFGCGRQARTRDDSPGVAVAVADPLPLGVTLKSSRNLLNLVLVFG